MVNCIIFTWYVFSSILLPPIQRSNNHGLVQYKYDFESILPHGLPRRNKFFENARVAHGRVNILHTEIANVPVPQCRGYLNLSRLPQESRQLRFPARPLFRSTKYTPAVYTNFLDRGLSNIHDVSLEEAWKQYFENKSASVKYILQGLVLDEIVEWQPFADSKLWSRDLEAWLTPPAPNVVAQSIQESLELVHSIGIVYGSALNLDSIWLHETGESGELRIFLTDFSLAEVGEPGSKKMQWKQAKELKWWKQQASILRVG